MTLNLVDFGIGPNWQNWLGFNIARCIFFLGIWFLMHGTVFLGSLLCIFWCILVYIQCFAFLSRLDFFFLISEWLVHNQSLVAYSSYTKSNHLFNYWEQMLILVSDFKQMVLDPIPLQAGKLKRKDICKGDMYLECYN